MRNSKLMKRLIILYLFIELSDCLEFWSRYKIERNQESRSCGKNYEVVPTVDEGLDNCISPTGEMMPEDEGTCGSSPTSESMLEEEGTF